MNNQLLIQLSRELLMASVELSSEMSKKSFTDLSPTEIQFLKAVDKVNDAYLSIPK